MSIYGLKAFAVAGATVAVFGGGALVVGVSASAPPTRAACVAPDSAAVLTLGDRQAELTQILTPAGSSLISSGSRGLVGLRESLNESLGCAKAVEQPAAAVSVVGVPATQVPSPYGKSANSPNCRIV
jgi:hypothetical protein